MNGRTSPALVIAFDLSGAELKVLGPDARPLQTYQEIAKERGMEHDRAEREGDALIASMRRRSGA